MLPRKSANPFTNLQILSRDFDNNLYICEIICNSQEKSLDKLKNLNR